MCLGSAWVEPFTPVFSTPRLSAGKTCWKDAFFLCVISEIVSLINGHSCQRCELFSERWNAKLCMEVLKTPSMRYNISLQLSHSISKYEAWRPALSHAQSRGGCARAAEHCTPAKLLFCWVIGFTFCPFANPVFRLIQSASPRAVKFFTSMGPIWFLY